MSCITSLDEIIKNDEEVIAVSMNFENLVGENTIDDYTITITPSGPTVSADSVSGDEIIFKISGGTDGYSYKVKISIELSDGQTLVGIGNLKVRGG